MEHDGAHVDLDALFRRERDRIHAMCLAILRDPDEADDAVQETFARMTSRRESLEGDPTGYLFVVARNVCRKELHRRSRWATRGAEGPASPPTPEDTAVQRGLLGFVWRQLARVEQRLLTDVFAGLSLAEIAEASGTSSDAVAQRVSRLRRRIRHMVAAPAALLVPMLRAGAAGQALLQRFQRGGLVGPLLTRLQTAEQAVAPLLVGVITGVTAAPAMGAAAAPSHAHAPVALAVPSPLAGASGNRIPLPRVLRDAHVAVPPPSPVAHPGLLRRVAPRPPDAGFVSFAASPSDYQGDRVVFAYAGPSGCVQPYCTQVWRSDDAGVSWKPLWSTNWSNSAFQFILPPDYPRDPTVFALDEGTLYRSDDGGATFVDVVPESVGTWASFAFDGTPSPGDMHFLGIHATGTATAGAPVMYTERDRTASNVTGLPGDVESVTLFAAPGASAAYFAVSELFGPGGLYSCSTPTTCTRLGAIPPGPPVAFSPSIGSDHVYYTGTTGELQIRSLDSDAVTAVEVPGRYVVGPVAGAGHPGGRVLDFLVRDSNSGAWGVIRVADGRLQPWSLSFRPDMYPQSLTRLPDGHLLVALQHTADISQGTYTGGGTLCSADDGATWAQVC